MKKLSLALLALSITSMPVIKADEESPQPKQGRAALRELFFSTIEDARALKEKNPLTVEQKTAVKAIFDRYQQDLKTAAAARVATQRALREAALAELPNEAAIRTAATNLGTALGDGAVLRMKLHQEIRPLLTPEQQDNLKTFFERLDARVDDLAASRRN